jgi:predicted nucleotidyltransferase
VFRDLQNVAKSAEAPVEGLYLFGSAARGQDRPGSDFDVLAVVREVGKVDVVHKTLAETAAEMYTRHGLRLSVVVMDLARLRTMHADGDALTRELLRDNRRIAGKRLEELIDGGTRKSKGSR